MGKTDPFVEVYCTSDVTAKRMRTLVVEDNLNPIWNFEGSLFVDLLRCQVKNNTIRFDVNDDDTVGADYIGSVDVDLIDILE
jgi:Ca2+-dependent lipid-binding protein